VTRYGPPEVVEIREVSKPAPRENEILIQVHATTVSSGDWRMRSLTLPPGFGAFGRLAFGFFKPRNPVGGNDLSGIVAAIGPRVMHFKPGDEVIAQCGMGMGAHAEFKVLAETGVIARKPANLGFVEAGAMGFGGGTALHFLKKAGIKAGDSILINGASGSVGSAMVQLAKYFGAEVTAVCSGRNAEMMTALGADHVIDYTKEDFTENGKVYDIVADTAGTAPFSRSQGSIAPGGTMLVILGGLSDMVWAGMASRRTGKTVFAGPANETTAMLEELAEIAAVGGFSPYIEASFPLEQIVEAHRLVETGRKRGNVIVTMPVMAGTRPKAARNPKQ
jgi:NADPH:quinone reductase-like Zn-dependent oxidoreductase